jgi:ATP-dependent Clp protease ATP-binding subunit ClpB
MPRSWRQNIITQEVGGKHLMMALLEQEGGVTLRLLEQAGIAVSSFKDGLQRLLEKIPSVYGYEGTVYMSGSVSRIIARAEKEAQSLKDEYVSAEHLILGIISEGENDLKEFLARMGLTRENLLGAMRNVRGSQR